MGVSFSDYSYLQRLNVAVPTITFGFRSGLIRPTRCSPWRTGSRRGGGQRACAVCVSDGTRDAIGATGRLDANGHYQYPPQQGVANDFMLKEWGSYIQDTWRMSPTVTLNAGLRWEFSSRSKRTFRITRWPRSLTRAASRVSQPGRRLLGAPDVRQRSCNIFSPGTLTGTAPHYEPVQGRTRTPTPIKWGNLAPNLGVAWRPNVQDGFMRTLLGDPEQADDPRRLFDRLRSQGFTDLAGVFTNNGGRHGGREPQPDERQPDQHLAAAVPRLVAARTAGICPEGANPRAGLLHGFSPNLGQPVNQTSINIFNPEHQDCLRAVVLGRLPARHQQLDGRRGAVHRHAAQDGWTPRTGTK